MNIVFIVPSLEKIAPVTVIVNIIAYLLKNEAISIEVMTLQQTPDNNYKTLLKQQGVRIYEYFTIQEAYRAKGDEFWNRIDIIHINSLKPNILAYLLQRRYRHLKSLATIHSVEKIDYVQTRGFLKGNFSYRFNAFLCKRRDAIVAVSLGVSNYLERMKIPNVKLIHNGIDFHKFKTYNSLKEHETIDLVQVGVINVNKNQYYSLRLVNYLVAQGIEVRLHIVGGTKDEAYQQKLAQYIVEHDLEAKVIFYGHQAFSELTVILSTKDILLMPSYSEGLPLSPLEGYFYNLPAITSTNGGLSEVNVEDKTGIFVNIDTESSFKKVALFIQENRYQELSKEVKAYALKNFNAELMGKKYHELYGALLAK